MMKSQDALLARNLIHRQLAEEREKRTARMLVLKGEIAEIEAFQPMHEARLMRAVMAAPNHRCPRCFIMQGTDVALVAVGTPPDGDPDVDYYRCADKCGFGNLP